MDDRPPLMSDVRWSLAAAAILAGGAACGLGGVGHGEAHAQEAIAGGECVRGPGGERFGGVVGVVRVERTPFVLAGARIAISQAVTAGDPASGIPGEAVADSAGRYRICPLPPGVTVLLEARRGDIASRRARAWIPRDSIVVLDLIVPLWQAGRARGRVRARDTGEPVVGARVSVPDLGVETLTGEQGGFALPALPPATYALRVQHLAFGERRDSLTVLPGKSVHLEIQVETRPIPVEPLVVEITAVRSLWLEGVGFHHRMQTELGTFITREEIERRRPLLLSDLFQTIPGMRVDRGRIRMTRVQVTRAPSVSLRSAGCDVQYFIDGRSVPLATGIDGFMPDDIEAIEVYRGPAEIPPEFNEGQAECGAILLWMRVAYERDDP